MKSISRNQSGGLVSAKDVALYFIKKGSSAGKYEDDSYGITNLRLQKLLFYAQAEYLKKNSKKLFKEGVQAWQYGPVVKEVYDWLKHCGAYNISDFDIDDSDCNDIDDKHVREFLDDIWARYSKYSAWFLSERSHEKGSAWDKTYRDGDGDKDVISEKYIRDNVRLSDDWE